MTVSAPHQAGAVLAARPAQPIEGSVLVVEEQERTGQALARFLAGRGILARSVQTGREALDQAADPTLFLVFTEVALADQDGLELLAALQALRPDVAVVLLARPGPMRLAAQALDRGAFFSLEKPFPPETALLLAQRAWELRALREARQRERVPFVRKGIFEFMWALAEAIDAKSAYTRDHSERVACLSRRLARRLGLPSEEVETIHAGALLHDLGKVGIPDELLDSRERLDARQMALMREHPGLGERILAPMAELGSLLPVVRHHHENWDGTGYPDGLRGEEIPSSARIVKVADTFDALTSDRPYRPQPCTEAEALQVLAKGKGTLYDPRVVEAFLALMHQGDGSGQPRG